MIIEQRNETIFFDVKEDDPGYDGDELNIPSFFLQEDEPPKGEMKDVQG